MVALSRDGMPLAQSDIKDLHALKQFIDEVSSMMGASDPLNSLFLPDRAAYLRISRANEFAKGQAAPLLLNNPFPAAPLRKAGIQRITAKLDIDAEGKITSVIVENKDAIPAALHPSLEAGLKKGCIIVPAIDKGVPVPGSCIFDYTVPAENLPLEIDRTWTYIAAHKDISIPSWLLLRPIPVPPALFSSVQGTDEKGVTSMSAYKVSSKNSANEEAVSHKEQMNAFNTEFFSSVGAAAVTPLEGMAQTVEDETYTWEKVASVDGFVDFANSKNRDFCVGYAYAEFDSPSAGPALMGMGSDDGVKIWLNGVAVNDRWVRRTSKIDEDIIPLTLAAGKNRLLIKIQNASGAWSFFARIRR